jgi:amino acid adenylation domain-containing protein
MSELLRGVEALSPEQRALFAARLKAAGVGRLDRGSIPRRSTEAPAPLSFAQQRLWFLHRLAPGSTAYHMPLALRLTGALDLVALRRALETIVARHESLRTTIRETERGPVQVIAPAAAVMLPMSDLGEVPEADREREARRLVAVEAHETFDLERGPLLRHRLWRLGERDHILQLTMHHIVSDGWSMGILFQELATLYRSLLRGVPAPLAEPPIQYADFAVWQQERLRSEPLRRELAYWREQLRGAPPVLALPTDWPRPRVSRFRGATVSLTLPRGLAEKLEELARREQGTLFMAVLAGFQAVLARWSGQHDILVGTPIAGRVRSELDGVIGCFLNTLVLRTDLTGNPSFRGLLARTRETALGAYANQELPFERLVEELQPARHLGHNPIFQVLFQLENTPRSGQRLPGLDMRRVRTGGGSAKFDLSLRLRERPDGLSCACTYSTELFDRETIVHLMEQYRAMLEQAVADPDRPIESHSLVTDRARSFLPDPTAPLAAPWYPTVPQEFARRVAEGPARPAISQAGRTWSYRQLAAAADGIAAALRARGLRDGGVVGLAGPASFGLVAAMLGVLSAGGVMLPVAPDLPARRKRTMLQEARAAFLLRAEPDAAWSDDLPGLEVLGLDGDTGRVADGALPLAGPPVRRSAPEGDQPAYVFFTSGTTGTPKGILGTHQGLGHFLAWQRDTFGIGPGDRCAQLTNLSFDVVLRDVFLPLTSGGTLCLPPDQLPVPDVLGWLAGEAVTVVHAVPSRSLGWLERPTPHTALPALRWVFLAGEPLSDQVVLRWREAAGGCRAANLYGPTETTLVKCFHPLPAELPPGIQAVGRPLPETQVLVLSASGRLCGVNEPGEVVIRTAFGTRGYLNAPEAQARSFQANPFRDDPTDVVYRTGDLGRYRPDGTLLVLARLDDQVKIRGVRIEPDEVGAVLSGHPGVEACAVIARSDDDQDTRLVAYVVAGATAAPTAAELRSYLADRLPSPFVPSTVRFLDRLPVTPNGKLDRRALQVPVAADDPEAVPYEAPRTPIETILAGIWAQVLGRERIGIHDDFFALGGHSLLATQVIARVRRTLGSELALRSLFEAPTVSALALAIARELLEREPAPAPARE